jgi:hypothetical protein
MAFEFDITHPSKHVPFGGASGDGDFVYLGVDLSAAAFRMTLAPQVGSAGVITLSNAAAGSQGISATYSPSYVHPVSGATVGATIVRPQIDETTFEALTWGATDEPLVLAYDMLVTPSGGVQYVWFKGNFTIHPGVGD